MKNPPQVAINLKPAQLIKWHRRIGMAAAPLLLILAVSGIALNHTDALELDKHHINSTSLLNWYGIKPPAPPRHFQAGDTIISQLGDRLFIDATPTIRSTATLKGGVATPMFIVIALPRELLLITPAGELVERINHLPKELDAVKKIGINTEHNVAVSDGNKIIVADANLLSWQTTQQNKQITWSATTTPNNAFNEALLRQYRNHDLTYEQLLLDLHSGRLFGGFGIYIMDATAALLILLALTGVWRWCQTTKQRRRD